MTQVWMLLKSNPKLFQRSQTFRRYCHPEETIGGKVYQSFKKTPSQCGKQKQFILTVLLSLEYTMIFIEYKKYFIFKSR